MFPHCRVATGNISLPGWSSKGAASACPRPKEGCEVQAVRKALQGKKPRGDLAQHEMILLALAHAANWTTAKVPYEDLVLQAWQAFPHAFSLRNHPEHPDASDIHKRLYQSLRPAGFVVSLGNKVFRL